MAVQGIKPRGVDKTIEVFKAKKYMKTLNIKRKKVVKQKGETIKRGIVHNKEAAVKRLKLRRSVVEVVSQLQARSDM